MYPANFRTPVPETSEIAGTTRRAPPPLRPMEEIWAMEDKAMEPAAHGGEAEPAGSARDVRPRGWLRNHPGEQYEEAKPKAAPPLIPSWRQPPAARSKAMEDKEGEPCYRT